MIVIQMVYLESFSFCSLFSTFLYWPRIIFPHYFSQTSFSLCYEWWDKNIYIQVKYNNTHFKYQNWQLAVLADISFCRMNGKENPKIPLWLWKKTHFWYIILLVWHYNMCIFSSKNIIFKSIHIIFCFILTNFVWKY